MARGGRGSRAVEACGATQREVSERSWGQGPGQPPAQRTLRSDGRSSPAVRGSRRPEREPAATTLVERGEPTLRVPRSAAAPSSSTRPPEYAPWRSSEALEARRERHVAANGHRAARKHKPCRVHAQGARPVERLARASRSSAGSSSRAAAACGPRGHPWRGRPKSRSSNKDLGDHDDAHTPPSDGGPLRSKGIVLEGARILGTWPTFFRATCAGGGDGS